VLEAELPVVDDGDVVLCVPVVLPVVVLCVPVVLPVVLVPDDGVPLLWEPVLPCVDDPDVDELCASAAPGAAPSATATTPNAKYRAAGRMNRLLLS